jgi:DNA-3-methyladenine glycosylase II
MNTTSTFTIVPDGPFSLEAASTFGFGHSTGRPTYQDAAMKLAFVTDDFEHYADVDLAQSGDGEVTGVIRSDGNHAAIESQVTRILSLDGSGADWLKVGESDPVLGGLQRKFPGLRPVLFHSPYEAAVWSIISTRRQRAQARVIRNRIASEHGETFGTGKEAMTAFPTPEKLLGMREVQGLDEIRVDRLHSVARAALEGRLDPGRILALDTQSALEHLQKLPGIGPMYATLILLRSTGARDLVTGTEPRMESYLAKFYKLGDSASAEQVAGIQNGWRPFRTWSSVLVRAAGEKLNLPFTQPSFTKRSRPSAK